ncbi:MAG: DUF3079 domain-containing protein [Armatimonadetes bacterium]|nr:DUF3079 domain-containing protein [Armatimonadota bacterium]
MMTRYPHHPAHPERVCWGCDRHCPADALACGSDKVRAGHPIELFGDDWLERGSGRQEPSPDGRGIACKRRVRGRRYSWIAQGKRLEHVRLAMRPA